VPVPIDLEFVAVSIVPAGRLSSIRSGLRWGRAPTDPSNRPGFRSRSSFFTPQARAARRIAVCGIRLGKIRTLGAFRLEAVWLNALPRVPHSDASIIFQILPSSPDGVKFPVMA
jgi:hypothetical protein